MAHFTALFPSPSDADTRSQRDAIRRGYTDGLRESSLVEPGVGEAWLLLAERPALTPRVARLEDGWIVVRGKIIDLDAAQGEFSATRLLAAIVDADERAINRFEGVFAAAGWHAPSRTAFALNDQASTMSLYVFEGAGGWWVSTVALPLARAVGARIDPHGAREFFARGTILTPRSMFDRVRRLDLGQRALFRDGRVETRTHWRPLQDVRPQSTEEASRTLSALARDRVTRLAAADDRVIADLTGGYDSRLVVTAAAAAGRLSAVTVDGPGVLEDVRIATDVAREMDWELRHFDTSTLWNVEIDADMRRELTYRTDGELAFTEVYHHWLSRPALAQEFQQHLTGGGGELLRGFPWFQEFSMIGRRRPANVENALAYRFFQEGPPIAGLFADDWYPLVVDALRSRLKTMFESMPGTLNTQQLDAAYLWRTTGFAQYASALNGWLATAPPLTCAEIVDAALALPWKKRLTSGLMRRITDLQVPRAARLPTGYGGTASPLRPGNAHRQLYQLLRDGYHLVRKLDRVRMGGVLSRILPAPAEPPAVHKPYLTDEFRAFLDPAKMRSRRLYRRDALSAMLGGSEEHLRVNEPTILRMATLEQVCVELDTELDAGFLVL